jgi:hypothetical protein
MRGPGFATVHQFNDQPKTILGRNPVDKAARDTTISASVNGRLATASRARPTPIGDQRVVGLFVRVRRPRSAYESSWADYSLVGRENYSGPLQPHDYVKSRLKLIDDQDQTGWQSRERAEVCDGLGGHSKTTAHFDPNGVRDAA